MVMARVPRTGDMAKLVISAPPLNRAAGLTSLLEHGPRQATFEGR